MVHGADAHVCVEKENASRQRRDDRCISDGDWESACHEKDDLSEPLINLKKAVLANKRKSTIVKKNDLVSTDILDGQKSRSFPAEEGMINPTAAKTKELLVYRRSRFRGAKSQGGCCNPATNPNAPPEADKFQQMRVKRLALVQSVEVEDVPASTHGVSVINVRELGNNFEQRPIRPIGKCLELFPAKFSSGSSQINPAWSEDELDALWMGVRRHREGNWVSILRDPTLHFSSYKTPQCLSERWTLEKVKALSNDHIQEPSIFLEGQQTGEMHPQAANPAWGTHNKRSTHQRNKFAIKKQSILLGGVFPLCDDAVNRFRGK